jgi:hypothetical protein
MFLAEDALVEAYRMLKPGGRACFAAWGPFEQPYWSSTMGVVHRQIGGPVTAPDTISSSMRARKPFGSLRARRIQSPQRD